MKATRRRGALPVLERTVGCWSCTAWSAEGAQAFWMAKRKVDLQLAASYAADHPQGEESERVRDTRKMIATVDVLVGKGVLGICLKKDAPREKPIGDLVQAGYLCNHWSARQGASIARAGAALDKTSDEVFADHVDEIRKQEVQDD